MQLAYGQAWARWVSGWPLNASNSRALQSLLPPYLTKPDAQHCETPCRPKDRNVGQK